MTLLQDRRMILGAYLVLLNLYDLFITRYLIVTGKAVEMNPVMQDMVHTNTGLVVKVAMPVAATIFAFNAPKERGIKYLVIGCLVYAIIGAWNTSLI